MIRLDGMQVCLFVVCTFSSLEIAHLKNVTYVSAIVIETTTYTQMG